MRRKRGFRRRYPNRKRVLLVVFGLLLVMLVITLILDTEIRPAVREAAAYKMEEEASLAITRAVERELIASDISYNDIVTLRYDSDGNVTALNTDIIKLNLLKSRVTEAANDAVVGMDGKIITVNTGNLTRVTMLTGRGPDIKLHLSLNGNVLSEFRNEFTAVGVNQTEHRIMICFHAKAVMAVDGVPIQTELSAEVCAAQTVIVGDVPNAVVR